MHQERGNLADHRRFANLGESRRVSRYDRSVELDSHPWADRVRSNTHRLATPKSATQR